MPYTDFSHPSNHYHIKRTYMAPASERIELQTEQMIATSRPQLHAQEAPLWTNTKDEDKCDYPFCGTHT